MGSTVWQLNMKLLYQTGLLTLLQHVSNVSIARRQPADMYDRLQATRLGSTAVTFFKCCQA